MITKNVFEIHDLTTSEILSDGLFFDDMSELLGAYQELYPAHEVVCCCRLDKVNKPVHQSQQDEFLTNWFNFVDENICNMY